MAENHLSGKKAVDFVVAALTLLNPPEEDGRNTSYHVINVQLFGEPPSRDPGDKAAVDWVYERLAKFLKDEYPQLFPRNIVMWAAIVEGPFAGISVTRDGIADVFQDPKESVAKCIEYYFDHRDSAIKNFGVQSVAAMLERVKHFNGESSKGDVP